MGFNPLYLLVPPFLIIVSIPLAIFACFTTLLAFTLLLIRVSIVYFELGIAVLRTWLVAKPSKIDRKDLPSPTRSPQHRRRSSTLSSPSSQDFRRPPPKSDSYISLLGAGVPDRDYEGVGGWRLEGEEPEETIWMGMNSRLELPLSGGQKRHQRSLTGSSQRLTWNPEALKMSPVQSRTRTPSVEQAGEGYFGLISNGRSSGEFYGGKESENTRRKSMSGSGEDQKRKQIQAGDVGKKGNGSSSTSTSSSRRSSKVTIKQTSHG